MEPFPVDTNARAPTPWRRWIFGAVLLAGVVAIGLHLSEGREFVALVERARPRWLIAAVLLQAATYLCQGEVFRIALRAGRHPLAIARAYLLSLAKLFVDQTVPSAGISGTVLFAHALERSGVARPVVSASVLLNISSYNLAYLVCLAVALVIARAQGHASWLLRIASFVFLLAGIAFTAAMLRLSGRTDEPPVLSRFSPVRRIIGFVGDADPGLVRNAALLARTGACHAAIFLLDAATIYALILALGGNASAGGVFASFMISNLFRTLGVVPGGLGTFEATSVLTLKMAGVPVAMALSATFLFRGLSFWLPMLPGFWISQRVMRETRPDDAVIARDPESLPESALLERLGSGPEGLSPEVAGARLREHGRNTLDEHRRLSRLSALWHQFQNPLLLLLVAAAAIATITGEWGDAAIVLAVVIATVGIGSMREYGAQAAAAALRARVRVHTRVVRAGRACTIPPDEVVPGDVVLLSAGSLVPADGRVLEANHCFVTEGVLTGESLPVEKRPGVVAPGAPLSARDNCVFMGTSVRSGSARCVVVATGRDTEYGSIAHRLTLRPPETEFDRGVRRFGLLLTRSMLLMVLIVFAANVWRGRPEIETLMFAVALAVGLSPELLPAILAINLARGASMMAHHGVLVRRLNAIENLGSMDVLCTDKTGTLTEGVVEVSGAFDAAGNPSPAVLELAAVNAALQAGLANPLDEAILNARRPELAGMEKCGEIPFDFEHRRVSVVLRDAGATRLVTKGAFASVVAACARDDAGTALDPARVAALEQRHRDWSDHGIRVLAVAFRAVDAAPSYDRDDERDMTLAGFVTFLDRPKEGVGPAIAGLAALGVSVKLITGDNRRVAAHVASLVGLRADRVLTGGDLAGMRDDALWNAAERTDLFVEVDPNQKARIIQALKKTGHVVGFLGDGINDAPAMHTADTSISVEHAVDVAREAADFVLLERHLDVIRRGIEEGRRTFANTLKYVLTTTSANWGNMISMAVASLFIPFLPLTAGQVLLNNFLSDIPAFAMADDIVDPELVERPGRWDIRFIGRFMVEFGVLSSVFDLLTFLLLLGPFGGLPAVFRTGWFVESLMTELAVALVVRTRRRCHRSRPGTALLVSTAVVFAVAVAIPYLPWARALGFVPLPAPLLALLVAITVVYVLATEAGKVWFYRTRAA